MKYIIDSKSRLPAYLQLYNQIKADIVNEIYPYGSKLNSKRILAADTGVSTITVEHTYALLADEGYIESRERSGYYVIFRKDDGFAANIDKTTPHFEYPNTHGYLPEFPFTVLSRAMRRVLSEYGEGILEKSPNEGCVELREELRRYLMRNRGINADISQIIIGSGAEYLYNLIVGMLGRERIFALESPSYKKIEQVYSAAGVSCQLLPLGSDGIETQVLAGTQASVLHISPYRSYPTGITASASKRHEYIRWAAHSDRFIVEDDFESEFSVSSKPEETLFSLSDGNKIIYLNTFSKTISSSLRMGYMVLPKQLVKKFDDTVGFYACTVSTYEQLVVAELIANGDFERHINRVRRAKRKEMQK